MAIIFSVVIAVIVFFVAFMFAQRIQKDFSDHLRKYDLIICLCIIFISVYLLPLVLPPLREAVRYHAKHYEFYEEVDWLTFAGGGSIIVFNFFYLLGIYTAIKILAEKINLTGRRLFYWTIGVFVFAGWAYMIFDSAIMNPYP